MKRRKFLQTGAGAALASGTQAGMPVPQPQPKITTGDFAAAGRAGLRVPPGNDPEAYVIGGNYVYGRTDRGIRHGMFRWKQTARMERGRLAAPQEASSPFIAERGSHLCGYTRKVFNVSQPNAKGAAVAADPAMLDWNWWERWEPARVADYVDMLDFFGYNLLETRLTAYPQNEKNEQAIRRRDVFHQRARRNGMRQMMQFKGTMFVPASGRHDTRHQAGGPLPYGAGTRDRYAEYYRRSAEAAAPYLDAVLTHWVDSGGWPNTPEHPCTIELLQDLHMKIHGAFRAVNPRIESFLSLWNLDHKDYRRWAGYEGVQTILGGDRIPKEVGLAMGRTYRPEEARKITTAGHRAGVWGWYLADNELVYTMHVHTHILRDYLQRIPDDAARLCAFHTLSNCQAETNIYSIYVGARMLWDPRKDPEVYLREAARLIYGPRLEDRVFFGLKAIGDVRCGKRCRGYWHPEANGVLAFAAARELAEEAWRGLRDAEIDRDYVPPTPFHRPPEVLLRELKGHVRALAAYMQFLRDGKTEVPAAEGPFEYYERMQFLRPGEKYWPFTVGDT